MPFRATRRAVTLPTLPAGVRSVDVCFGDDRVWSIDLDATPPLWRRALAGRGLAAGGLAIGRDTHPWPVALAPYLVGSTTLVLRDSADGGELARAEARFSDAAVTARVLDDAGVPLAVNKWGRLGRTLDVGDGGVQGRILDRTEEIIAQLASMGLRPFIVGGTLLGAVRGGALLPHDDDADVAYLSEYTDPADVAREGLAIGHRLETLGHELVRHSAAHMQLYFRDASGGVDHYVDVFAAFFTDSAGGVSRINQPFHVRGEMTRAQMLPFGTVTIDGRPFPAPADTERWLTINYDENWRTPIPGYRLATPLETRRRFENWFGLFNAGREFWDDHHRARRAGPDQTWRTGERWIAAHADELHAAHCIDLGCGSGALGARLAGVAAGSDAGSRRVIAVDYSRAALVAAERHAAEAGVGDRITALPANLLQLDSLAVPARAGIDGPFDVVANHLLDQGGPEARSQALRLIRMALRSGGTALATLYARRDPSRPDGEPSNWFCAEQSLRQEAVELGLGIEVTRLKPAAHERRRAPYGVRFHLDGDAAQATDKTTRGASSRGASSIRGTAHGVAPEEAA